MLITLDTCPIVDADFASFNIGSIWDTDSYCLHGPLPSDVAHLFLNGLSTSRSLGPTLDMDVV
jgi:hypothetical protein